MPEGKDNFEPVKSDPKTGEVRVDANHFFEQMSAKEDAQLDTSFDETRELMETAPNGQTSKTERTRDTRGIKEITRNDYNGRLGGGTPAKALETSTRSKPQTGQSPRKF